jgi:hypothetical protein
MAIRAKLKKADAAYLADFNRRHPLPWYLVGDQSKRSVERKPVHQPVHQVVHQPVQQVGYRKPQQGLGFFDTILVIGCAAAFGWWLGSD